MKNQREKFETLDALRFFSFLLVFLFHLPPEVSLFKFRGDVGVWFFFSLSGFLISYFLLLEKKNYSNINLKNYFARRSLRIWPLYFFALILAFIYQLLHSIYGTNKELGGYEPNWLVSCLFLENYRVLYFKHFSELPIIPVLWSLCVEEHFYVIWGLILKYTKSKNTPYWIFSILLLSYFSKFIYSSYSLPLVDIFTNFDYFMYGSIPAYLYVYHKDFILNRIIKTNYFYKLLICLLGTVYVLYSPYLKYDFKYLLEPLILGLFFSSILFIILPKNNMFKISESNIFSKMGIYTYGLYIYHSLIISLTYLFILKSKIELNKVENFIILFSVSLLITSITSILSYRIIESPFLKLKEKFQSNN